MDYYCSLSWREFLQRFGTEMGREVLGPDFWVEQFADRYLAYEEHMPDNTLYVVRDVRFNNEAELITDYAGDIWQVHRPGYEGDEHVSEAGINENYIRGDIGNDGTIEELHNSYQTGCSQPMDHVTPYQAVKEFHIAYGLSVRKPGDPISFSLEDETDDEAKLFNLRWELNNEEFLELEGAWEGEDLVEYVDAVCDLIYVLAGSLVSFGVDLDACFAEVHSVI